MVDVLTFLYPIPYSNFESYSGLDNLLAVRAMFPVPAATEMAGQVEEKYIAVADLTGLDGVWDNWCNAFKKFQNMYSYS